MSLKYFSTKQPWEAYYLAFDFTKELGGEAIAMATITVTRLHDGEDVTIDLVNPARQNVDGSMVYFWIQAGVSGTRYKIECRIEGDNGSRYEMDGGLEVLEK